MLDSRIIGRTISKLRKEADLTQVELSDRLNVSHQAVSKWERGESLPDIETLMELAKVFHYTIDELLYGEGYQAQAGPIDPLIEKVAAQQLEDVADLVNTGDLPMEKVIDVAPLLKASMLQKVTKEIENAHFTLNRITELAPFLDEETLDELVLNGERTEIKWKEVESLAPFISASTLFVLLGQPSMGEPSVENIVQLAPFLGKYTDHFASGIDPDDTAWETITTLAPFISKETLKRFIDGVKEFKPDLKAIKDIAPFLHEHTDPLVHQALEQGAVITWNIIEDLAPFVESETIMKLLELLNEELTFGQYVTLVPFLREYADVSLNLVQKNHLSWDDIEEIAPFIKKETLSTIMDEVSVLPTYARQITDLAPFVEKEKLAKLIAALPTEKWDPEALTDLAPFMKKADFKALMTKLLKRA